MLGGNNVKGTKHRKLKFIIRDVVPDRIIKWPYHDWTWNYALRCKIIK